jgi:hypothetical protein
MDWLTAGGRLKITLTFGLFPIKVDKGELTGCEKHKFILGTANEVLCSSEAGIEEGVITNPSKQACNEDHSNFA